MNTYIEDKIDWDMFSINHEISIRKKKEEADRLAYNNALVDERMQSTGEDFLTAMEAVRPLFKTK